MPALSFITLHGYTILGGMVIGSGLLLNEWTFKVLSSGRMQFEEIEQRIVLIVCEVIALCLGFLIIKYKKQAVLRIVTVLLSLILVLFCGELLLFLYAPFTLRSDSPVWIPPRYAEITESINAAHVQRSRMNEFGFNDEQRRLKNEEAEKRIAILGDSFVWGDGVHDSVIWCNKLQQLFAAGKKNVEILKWGKRAWSTLDEFNFYKTSGVAFKIDIVLVGFVVNDPVMDSSNALIYTYINKDRFIYRALLQPAHAVLPNVTSFLLALADNVADRYFGYGYSHWIERLYSRRNLEKYQSLLNEFSSFCKQQGVHLLFVLTPENHNPALKEKFDLILPLLDTAGIDYVNLYPAVEKRLRNYSVRELWANPGDPHPGDLVTTVYAESVYDYLSKIEAKE